MFSFITNTHKKRPIKQSDIHFLLRKLFILTFSSLFVILFTDSSFAQNNYYLKIFGQVKNGKTKIPNATVQLFENNTKINTVTSNTNGDFTFNLDFDKSYILEISAQNYATKKILIDTKIKEKDLTYKYTFTVELFEQYAGVDYSVLNKPVTKIVYNAESDAFDYDIPYTESMRKQLDQITAQIESVKKQTYQQIISKADELFKTQKYEDAITYYEKAIDADPYNDYPDKQIMECEKLLVQRKNNENNYTKYITQGDQLYAKQDYTNAKNAFQNALTIKPTEIYPKTKLAEIDKLMADKAAKEKAAAEAKAKEDQYNAAISKGDVAMTKQNYDEAKTAYNQALTIKPNETYPKTKLAEIDKLIADKAAKEKAAVEAKAKDDQYNAVVAKGDAAMTKQNYEEAKTAYNQALTIKPNETYPKTKLAEIDKFMADKSAKEKAAAEAKAKDDQYNAVVAKGDEAFEKNQLSEAYAAYNEALKLKPNEVYPKNKIVIINNLLAQKQKKENENNQKEQAYKNAIDKGDNFYNSKDYSSAITFYQTASNYKPTETYPKQRITECQNLLKQKNEDEQKRIADEKQRQIDENREKMKKLEEVDFSNKITIQRYLSDLARQYPEGVTEEHYADQSKKINRVIINKDGVATEYREVIHSWGGVFYFKNGQSITKNIFLIETKK